MHRPQSRLANPAPRHIDDPLERQIVGRLHRRTHIRDSIPDFGPFVEPQTAHHPIRHTNRDQSLLERSGLESRPRSTLEIVPAESPAWAASAPWSRPAIMRAAA